ncbi:MAG: hypothetical protein JWQ63_3686 [Mucilaginibacter sp.]|nr:hypothetical protein [Mucilaginibacter sp.]
MKFISPTIHGIIDYFVVIFLLASPTIFGFTGLLAIFTYALAGIHLLMTILTDYNVGLIKIIPFHTHGFIESVVGVVLIALGYTLFNDNAAGKLFYIIFGTIILYTWLVTDYRGILANLSNITMPVQQKDPKTGF